jgi:pimeloyl-ACP methyl ester carboxylesterase
LANTPTSTELVVSEAGKLAESAGADFEALHVCRKLPKPALLEAAYEKVGSVWRGSDAIPTWKAEPNDIDACTLPTLIIRGEHDFVTAGAAEGWKRLSGSTKYAVLENCSHHALLEDTDAFVRILIAHLATVDERARD